MNLARFGLGCTDLDNLGGGRWSWDWGALFAKTLDVEVDRLLDQLEYLLAGCGCGNTTRQIGDIRPEASVGLFDDD
ncbi:MAG: hypothetical protein MUC56_13585 [Thermoanaerobaculales bacterium]|jgi:hypothetical protein|nr:hypothetical protein [Thermoanaerobaculales bacterium]